MATTREAAERAKLGITADETPLSAKLPLRIMAQIIGGAFRSGQAPVYFRAAENVFWALGRNEDAMALAYMRELHVMGEIELLMALRAQWLGNR